LLIIFIKFISESEVFLQIGHSLWYVSVWKGDEVFSASLLHQVAMIVVGITSDSASKFHVFSHQSDSVGMDGAEVSIFEDAYEVCFGGFL